MKLVKNKLKLVHYPNVPCKPFEVFVDNEIEALKISNILANQHLFLFKNNFIPDYSNVITLLMWDEFEKEWIDYYNEEEGIEWNEFEEAFEREKRINNYALSLVKHNVIDNMKDALAESTRFFNKRDKGLEEPMLCPHHPDMKISTVHNKDGSITITHDFSHINNNYES